MASLGFERFAVVGHDRGARVGHRLAPDAPDAVTRLALVDIVPTRHVPRTTDEAPASASYHWFFLSAPGGVPERMIGADPESWLRSMTVPLLAGDEFDPAARAAYVRCFSDPPVGCQSPADRAPDGQIAMAVRAASAASPSGASTSSVTRPSSSWSNTAGSVSTHWPEPMHTSRSALIRIVIPFTT
jgi:haloacetate dehalogenase